MKQRKLLMLGGADIQVTAIQKAVELGYHVTTADYLPNNPGHKFSHAYCNVSTTDREGILALARELRVDGISPYASDPAALTAAYVAEHLGLPGDIHNAVLQIQDKVLLRQVQMRLGVPCPEALLVNTAEEIVRAVRGWKHGGIIKPADTAGSRGIQRVRKDVTPEEAQKVLDEAMGFSRSKRVVLEQYLMRKSPQMTGDALIVHGKLVFWCFGDVHFNDTLTGLVPRGVTIPGTLPREKVDEAMAGLQCVLDDVGIRMGVFNIDLFIDEDNRAIVVDVGARNGGNMLNTLYHMSTGVDLIELSLRQCMGEPIAAPVPNGPVRYVGHIVVHATRSGTFNGLRLSGELERRVFYRSLSVHPGDRVSPFINSGHRLGLLLVEFPSAEEMRSVYNHIYQHMMLDLSPLPATWNA